MFLFTHLKLKCDCALVNIKGWCTADTRNTMFKGELNPKIKFVLFERTLKITEYVIFQFLIPLLRF